MEKKKISKFALISFICALILFLLLLILLVSLKLDSGDITGTIAFYFSRFHHLTDFTTLLGLISGIVALQNIRKNREELKGRWLACLGIILALLFVILRSIGCY